MASLIKSTKSEIILENLHTKIKISLNDATVTEALRLDKNISYLSDEKCQFITLFDVNDEIVDIKKISLDNNIITVECEYQTIRIEVKAFDNYFTFEILDDIKEPLEKITFVKILCNYEIEGEDLWGTVGVTMTVNANPVYVPRAKQLIATAQAERTTGNTKGAKYALVSAPLNLHRNILKEVCNAIDKNKGITLRTCGPWAKEYLPNRENYTILHGTKKEYIDRAEEYKSMGIDCYDIHHSTIAYTQGNFKCADFKDMNELKEKFTNPLKEKGISLGLHTYVHYIHPSAVEYLADPKWQKDLWLGEEYTISEDISADATEIPVEESLAELSTDFTYFSNSMPYILIGNELVSFNKGEKKFVSCARGVCGTKAVEHKKGEKIRHCKGMFNLIAPIPGSPLFLEIAHNTAKAYNEGGFSMIYLDAMDGMWKQTNKAWYYDALFTHEIIKNCKTDPIVEYADTPPSLWGAMGRPGAWDYPNRGYKGFNKLHVWYNNKDCDDCHLMAMMGWYNFYPQNLDQPGNYNLAYHHFDDTEYVSSLCLINNYSMVMCGGVPKVRCAALQRNVDIYLKYYNLLKRDYFSEEYLNKLKDPEKMYFLKNKGKDKWLFEEKAFEFKRYYDFADEKRNKNKFNNPFKSQTPFVRFELGMSTVGTREKLLLPIDETKQIPNEISHSFGGPVDLTKNSAIKVKVIGNGKKGSAVRVTLLSRSIKGGNSVSYVIDTDYVGEREYVFFENQKGERPDLPFDKRYGHFFNVYLNSIHINAVQHIKIDTAGDCEGVRIGNVYGCMPIYDVVKNPKVKVGKSEIEFVAEVKSTDFIEFDGKEANVLDRYGNKRPVQFRGELKVPHGNFTAELSATSLNDAPMNTKLTFGFTGKEIK